MAFQNEWYASMFPESFTKDFFVTFEDGVIPEPVITNGISYDKNSYKSRAEAIREERANSETDSSKKAADSSEESNSSPVNYDDPIGFEGTVSKELNKRLKTIYRQNSKLPIRIEYHFKAPVSSEIYMNLSTARILTDTNVFVNGIMVNMFESNCYYSQIFRIGSFKEGEDVTVTILSDEADWSYIDMRFGLTKVKIDVLEDGYAKFTVNGLKADEMVITTIPAESGWTLTIDGQSAELTKYQDAFLAFKCPEGTHTVELSFVAPGLKAGAAVSCAGIVCLAVFVLVDKTVLNKRKKEIKNTEVKTEV